MTKRKEPVKPSIAEAGYVFATPCRLVGVITEVEPKVSHTGHPYVNCKVVFSEVDYAYCTITRIIFTRWADMGFVSREWTEEQLFAWLKDRRIEVRMKTEEFNSKFYIRLDPIQPLEGGVFHDKPV